MIVEAMTLLLRQLNDYIAQADGSAGAPVQAVWGNIAQLDRPEVATELDNHIVLSLVNLEEERALKNGRIAATSSTGDVGYRNRPVHLNLFLLFTANYRNYGTALRRLAQVLTFFQGKQKFTFANSPGPNLPQAGIADFSLAMDLLSLSFEEVNHLWGFLGTKQSPFAIYRGRLVVIADQRLLETGAMIQDIEVTSRDIDGMIRYRPLFNVDIAHDYFLSRGDVVLEAHADADRAALTSLYAVNDFLEIVSRRHHPVDAGWSQDALQGHGVGIHRRRPAGSVSER